MFGGAEPAWRHALNKHTERFGVHSSERLAMFLAQLHHESAGLTRLIESFRYTANRLLEVFPRHFPTREKAEAYIKRGPKAIANKVYGNRMGNGGEGSGDGWKYRGRGPIQLTGRENYQAFGDALGVDLVEYPNLAAYPDIGTQIACRYWQTRGCNLKADAGDIRGTTKVINGGYNGLKDREATWRRFCGLLGVEAIAA